VELDVLTIGEVGGVTTELLRDPRDDAQLLGGELAAVDAHAEHEEGILQLVRLEGGRATAVDAGPALRVQSPDAESAVEVRRVDRGESALRVDGLDALAHGETVVDLLPLLVRVQRRGAVDLPLSVRPRRRSRQPAARCGGPPASAESAARVSLSLVVMLTPGVLGDGGCGRRPHRCGRPEASPPRIGSGVAGRCGG
jgi:hypothetical protein